MMDILSEKGQQSLRDERVLAEWFSDRFGFDWIEKLEAVMENAHGELERISLVQTGVGIGTQPVAWMYDFLNPDSTEEVIRNWVTQDRAEIDGAKGFNVRSLYTVPPQRQPLDDLTILDIADKHLHDQETYQALAFARAIEREIKDNK
jgi:GTPase SAR1 family protein